MLFYYHILLLILSLINSTTIYYNIYADDKIISRYINDTEYPFNGNSWDYSKGSFDANEGDYIKFIVSNDYLSGGIFGTLIIDNNEFRVGMFYSHFWGVKEYPASDFLINPSCTENCMLGNQKIGNFTYFFNYPFIRYVKFGEEHHQLLSDLSISYDSYQLAFQSHRPCGSYFVDGIEITNTLPQTYEISKTLVFKPTENNCVDILLFHISVNSIEIEGKHILYISSDKVGKDGFECKFNMTYSVDKPYCYCQEDYYHIIDEEDDCYNSITIPHNYYLDNELKVYRLCNIECFSCFGPDNNQCLSCYSNKYLVEDYPNICYTYNEVLTFPNSNYFLYNDGFLKHCKKKWYPPSDGEINQCVDECPSAFPLEIISIKKCVSSCPDGLYIYKNGCYEICPSGFTNVGSICIENSLLSTPVDSFVSSEQPLDVLKAKIEKNFNEYVESIKGNIKGNDYYIQLYPIDDTSNECNEISSIDIGQCEQKLRSIYSIPANESLYILKVDKESPNSITNKVEFTIYNSDGKELNLSYCASIDITIDYVLSNTGGINYNTGKELSKLGVDMYNRSDTFYNDKCFPYSSKDGDMILNDRVSQYYISVDFCEEGCIYEGVNYETNKVKCNCNNLHEKVEFVEKKESESFFNSIYKETNLEIVKCYKDFFKKDIFHKNKGLYITSSLFLIQLILSIAFFIIGVSSVIKEVESESRAGVPEKEGKLSIIIKTNSKMLNTTDSFTILQSTKRNIEKENNSTLENEELNLLPYKPALELDQRTIFKFFYIMLLSKLDLINIFFFLGPLELFPICLSSYLFAFTLDITFNAILFSDDIISEKYNNGGKMNKYSSLGLSIISSIISYIISSMIAKLITYSSLIERLLKEKNFSQNFWIKMNKYMKIVKVRLVFFCILELVITLFCAFFNGLFCKIYKGSQDNWIMDFIIGIGTSLITTLGVSVFITITRFIGLRCKCHYIYNVSIYCSTILN